MTDYDTAPLTEEELEIVMGTAVYDYYYTSGLTTDELKIVAAYYQKLDRDYKLRKLKKLQQLSEIDLSGLSAMEITEAMKICKSFLKELKIYKEMI